MISASRHRRGNGGAGRLLAALCAGTLLAVGLLVWWLQPPPRPELGQLQRGPGRPASGDSGVRPVADVPARPRPAPATEPAATSAEPAAALAEPAVARERQPAPGLQGGAPRLAIIIDDLGRSVAAVEKLAAIGVQLSYAVLPFESQTPQVVAALRERGAEILCHLPMEAHGSDAGQGALTRAMDDAELRDAAARALAAVPGAVGANNHMGSALAADLHAMDLVLGVLRDHGIFFVDSRTSPDTVAYTVARRLGLPAAERQVFLDNERTEEAIAIQLFEAVAVARQRGGAVAIAHPYPETIAVLRRELPRLRDEGLLIVPVSRLLTAGGDRTPAAPTK
jgi:polysaccharide deacetylase 2 family uncharacterized protein YibQ